MTVGSWTTLLLLQAAIVHGTSLSRESRDVQADPGRDLDLQDSSHISTSSGNHWGSLVCNCQPQVVVSDKLEEKLDQIEGMAVEISQLKEDITEIKVLLSKLIEEPATQPTVTATPTRPTECPLGFQFLSGTDKCFRFFGTETKTWSAASNACSALSGQTRLLTLETEDMYLAFEDFFRGQNLPQGLGRGSWLGGQEMSGQHAWLSGEPLNYSNHWYSGYGGMSTGLKMGICCGSSTDCGLFNLDDSYVAYYACEIY